MRNILYGRYDFEYLFTYLFNVFQDLYELPRVMYKYNIEGDRIICVFKNIDNQQFSISKMDVTHGDNYDVFMNFFDSILDHYQLDKSIWYTWLSTRRYIQ